MRIIKPMLAESTRVKDLNQYVNDDEWVMEQKLDGDRLLIHIENGAPQAMSRRGEPYTKHVPDQILADCSGPQWEGEWVLDGELLDGTYFIFDLPHVVRNGEQFIGDRSPWSARHFLLTQLFAAWKPVNCQLVFTATSLADKAQLVHDVVTQDGEGVMVKHAENRYLPGRSDKMLKAKFTSTLEAFILQVGRGGKRSISVGLYNDKGDVVDVGNVTMSDRNLERVSVGNVVEVRYLYCGAGNRLYQPAYIKIRDDKTPAECTMDQLKFVNKAVLYRGRS